MSSWISIKLDGPDLEERISLLFDQGISGSSMEPDGCALCYLSSEDGILPSELKTAIADLGLSIVGIEQIEDQNWTQSCEELFETVAVGTLNIIPVKSFDEGLSDPRLNDSSILIIPGTGFGTGHHPTTFSLLQLMQHPSLTSEPPTKVLDAGTGSGILAIGICKLFDCQVDAYEVDPMAVENAIENVKLNRLENRISVFTESVHRCDGSYELVIANLYAELLEMLCTHLVERSKKGAHLLLSGIRIELLPQVEAKYLAHGLTCVERVKSGEWSALLLQA